VAAIPAAIRPDPLDELSDDADVAADASRRHVTALGLFGWGLGALLVALAVVAAVLLNS
jgi:hypothetical protein